MPRDFYRDVARLLSEAGWRRTDGGKGSHEKWRHATSGRTVIVPHSKSRHTANEVLRQAGLPKAF
ncbi:MAG TPA: type II toxin-antitoxin system HicA family toxin [Caulobacteraceae bacterium]|nr:type II toxin-antitoxin system HicA family toxin [Caulobacteraceae bacterium]